MPTTTPRDALIHELACAIEAKAPTLDDVPVRRGFPASGSRDDDFVLPSISVSVQTEEAEKARRKLYRETVLENGFVEQLFEVERITMGGTIELWTKSKNEREPIELELDSLLAGAQVDNYGTVEPPPPGLVLDLSLLYEARVRVRKLDKNQQDASGARDGYFRLLYSFEATVPNLIRVEYKKAIQTTTTEVDSDVDIDC